MFRWLPVLCFLLSLLVVPFTGRAEGPEILNAIGRDTLQWFDGERMRPYNERQLEETQLFVLYYSAQWCAPCRFFTPEFLATYQRLKKAYPAFEVIFISHDLSAKTQERHMRHYPMPWPAVRYGARTGLDAYRTNDTLPNLVVVTPEGKVLARSHVKQRYIGPESALAELERLVAEKAKSR